MIYADRVLEYSTTTGASTMTLAGAISGYRTWSSVCSDGDTGFYYIEGVDNNGIPTGEWETGLGTWNTGNLLSRSVAASSNANTPVNFSSGTKRIALTLTAGTLASLVASVKTMGKRLAYPNALHVS